MGGDGVGPGSWSRSCEVKGDAAELKKDAHDLEKLVNNTYKDIHDLVNGTNKIAELLKNTDGLNLTERLRIAEEILKGMRDRDFSDKNKDAKEEKRRADEFLKYVQEINSRNINTTE